MKVSPLLRGIQAETAPAPAQANAMIEIDHVSQIFRTSGRQDHLALSDISLTIEDGAFVSAPLAAENPHCFISSGASSIRRKAWRR